MEGLRIGKTRDPCPKVLDVGSRIPDLGIAPLFQYNRQITLIWYRLSGIRHLSVPSVIDAISCPGKNLVNHLPVQSAASKMFFDHSGEPVIDSREATQRFQGCIPDFVDAFKMFQQ